MALRAFVFFVLNVLAMGYQIHGGYAGLSALNGFAAGMMLVIFLDNLAEEK